MGFVFILVCVPWLHILETFQAPFYHFVSYPFHVVEIQIELRFEFHYRLEEFIVINNYSRQMQGTKIRLIIM